ncbi:unnamed protein product [Prorocentrum cordatum]|uniref:Uncharacterized protein n=1 Tax=Prorocentrum cordatum TaxID=2364126 RepID=A0ABN9YFH9_9DINO|nr:unnamed protein product [Polarella glacialis]
MGPSAKAGSGAPYSTPRAPRPSPHDGGTGTPCPTTAGRPNLLCSSACAPRAPAPRAAPEPAARTAAARRRRAAAAPVPSAAPARPALRTAGAKRRAVLVRYHAAAAGWSQRDLQRHAVHVAAWALEEAGAAAPGAPEAAAGGGELGPARVLAALLRRCRGPLSPWLRPRKSGMSFHRRNVHA